MTIITTWSTCNDIQKSGFRSYGGVCRDGGGAVAGRRSGLGRRAPPGAHDGAHARLAGSLSGTLETRSQVLELQRQEWALYSPPEGSVGCSRRRPRSPEPL